MINMFGLIVENFLICVILFHLPSLYPQYVFLVQIPLDLMFAWQKYHQDKKMEQTSTTGNNKSSDFSHCINILFF